MALPTLLIVLMATLSRGCGCLSLATVILLYVVPVRPAQYIDTIDSIDTELGIAILHRDHGRYIRLYDCTIVVTVLSKCRALQNCWRR